MSYNKLAAAKAGGATVGTIVGGTVALWAVINHTAIFFGTLAALGVGVIAFIVVGVMFSKFYVRFDPVAHGKIKAEKKKRDHDFRIQNSRWRECPDRRNCEYGCS